MADGMMRYLSTLLSLPQAGDGGGGVLRIMLALPIMLFSVVVTAEELPDPTRPPASLIAPIVPAGGAAANLPAGLQSIIISKTRRAAIIGGETVELGGKYGDAKLIEVNEGGIVLRSAQGLQVMTLFPDVKITGQQKTKMKPQSLADGVQSGRQKNKPAAHKEKK